MPTSAARCGALAEVSRSTGSNPIAASSCDFCGCSGGHLVLVRRGSSRDGDHAQFFQHVLRAFHQFGTLLDQPVAAFGQRRMDRTWNGEHFAPLLQSLPRGDQRSAVERCLHDQTAARQAADHAIATGKVCRQAAAFRAGTPRRARPRCEPVRELAIARRVNLVQARCRLPRCSRRAAQATPMCRAVDSERQPADDRKPASLRACANASASRMPLGVALRLPTTASGGVTSSSTRPLTNSNKRRIGGFQQGRADSGSSASVSKWLPGSCSQSRALAVPMPCRRRRRTACGSRIRPQLLHQFGTRGFEYFARAAESRAATYAESSRPELEA